MTHPAYALMLEVAKTQKWPESYATDLTVHDKNTLAVWGPSVPFVWALASSATILIRSDKRNGSSHAACSLAKTMAEYGVTAEKLTTNKWGISTYAPIEESKPLLFAWTGRTFDRIDEKQLAVILMGRR